VEADPEGSAVRLLKIWGTILLSKWKNPSERKERHMKWLKSLLDPNRKFKDEHGLTPLHWAAIRGNASEVGVLVGAGADKETKDKDGGTPLHAAAMMGEASVVGVLIHAGADKEAKDKDGFTPLFLAALHGHASVVELLIQAGADTDAKDRNSFTPLHYAALHGHASVVELLVQAGADKEATIKGGLTPLDVAAAHGHASVVEILRRAPQSHAENLLRWERSGFPRKWVDDHNGQWTHSDWLDLLERLKRTDFWPMEPAAIGRVLEEHKEAQRSNAASQPRAENDCPADVVELIDTLFAQDGDAAHEQRKKSAEEQLKEHPKRAAAITLLTRKFREDPKENEYRVCNIVEAIGTPDSSFELLLEIFKSGRKTKVPFDEWGNLKVEQWGPNEDYATQPAYLLVCKIENGPSRLKKCLSRTEYEEVVARAHSWNGSDRPLLAQALAEIGSKLAVLLLLSDILQTERKQETRDPAIRALGSIGHQYLPLLIENLKFQRQNRETQTTYLRDILSVLAICGDKTCVDPIVAIARQDATIEGDARRALAAIATRDGSVKIPKAVGAQPIPVRRLTPSGDRYVDRCFDCEWSELDEPRIWSSRPELKSVTDLAKEGQDTAALAQLAKVWTNYRDHDFVYAWKATILARQVHKSDAISVLNEGLSRCRKKFVLCATRAEIEYNAGDLNEAVVWMIRSAVSQISAQSPIQEGPFLYLAYIADAFGDHKSKDQLLKVVDRWTELGRLDDSAINRINSLVAAQGNRSMSVAIDLLCREFL
jgi:hypothetical protein